MIKAITIIYCIIIYIPIYQKSLIYASKVFMSRHRKLKLETRIFIILTTHTLKTDHRVAIKRLFRMRSLTMYTLWSYTNRLNRSYFQNLLFFFYFVHYNTRLGQTLSNDLRSSAVDIYLFFPFFLFFVGTQLFVAIEIKSLLPAIKYM